MKLIKSKKAIVLLSVLVVVAISAIGAYAYFTSSGHGSGSATTGSASNWTVTTDAATGGLLFPGHGLDTIAYHVANPGSGNQELNQVVIQIADTDPITGDPVVWSSGACTKDDFSLNGAAAGASVTDTYGGPTNDVAPLGTRSGSTTVALLDTGVPQDDCQGVTVPLYLAAS